VALYKYREWDASETPLVCVARGGVFGAIGRPRGKTCGDVGLGFGGAPFEPIVEVFAEVFRGSEGRTAVEGGGRGAAVRVR